MVSPAAQTALTSVPNVVSPLLDSSARAVTSIADFRHTAAATANVHPTYSSTGHPHPPGKSSGIRITTERAGALPSTASGAPLDPFAGGGGGGGSPRHRTRSELLAARRAAARAPDSYDLGGDGVVDPKEYFYATKFDANGDGDLSQEERETARGLMKSAASNLVFVSPRGAPQRGAFTRYSHAVVPGHNVTQHHGAIISEQLEGYAALTRSKLPGGGGPAAAVGPRGAHLPPDIAEKVGTTLMTGTAGAQRGVGVEVDLDTSDNVTALHVEGAAPDFDRVVVKPGFRAELARSGAKLRSELLAKRRAAALPSMSYDLDGDGAVSARDFFFAARRDRRGALALSREERAAAAAEADGGGVGAVFVEVKGDGAGQRGHRVVQLDGMVLGDNLHGFAPLTTSRLKGEEGVRSGADGNLHFADGSTGLEGDGAGGHALGETAGSTGGGSAGGAPATRRGPSGGTARDGDGLTIDGRVVLETVAGAVTDYDTVTVKPQHRPALVASGSRTASELKARRRLDKRPDPSFDLSGAGAVSEADYQIAKRFDVGDKGFLTAEEGARARAALAEGLRDTFLRLSTGSQAGQAARVFQGAGGGVVAEGADFFRGDGGGGEAPYDAAARRGVVGVLPAMTLPPALSAGGTIPAGHATVAGGGWVALGATTAGLSATAAGLAGGGALAGAAAAANEAAAAAEMATLAGATADGVVVRTSMGVVPGVARAVVRWPGGRQEAYGGYGGGAGAGGPTNVTAPPVARAAADGAGGAAPTPLTSTAELTATASIPWAAGSASAGSQRTPRPPANLAPEAPFRTHNQTTFTDLDAPGAVHRQAPFALAGVGGAGDALAGRPDMAAQRSWAARGGLLTATQLRAARRPRAFDTADAAADGAAGGGDAVAAGAPSDRTVAAAVAAATSGNSQAVAAARAWALANSTVAAAAALGATAAALSPKAPPFGASTSDFAARSARHPWGAPVVLDATARGEYVGGTSALPTSRAEAAMPPQFAYGGAKAAEYAAALARAARGSPMAAPARAAAPPSPRSADAPPAGVSSEAPAPPVRGGSGSAAQGAGPAPAGPPVEDAALSAAAPRVPELDFSGGGSGGGAYSSSAAASTGARLPAYMSRSISAAHLLPVDPQELPSDTIKPGALDESVRTLEATTRGALLAARRRDAKLVALSDAGEGAALLPVADGELYPAHFNDSTAHSHRLTAEGLGSLSKTRTQLRMRRAALALEEALPCAPGEPLGIHPAPLPRFAERLSPEGTPWYRDASARERGGGRRGAGDAGFTDVVSPLDGAAPPPTDAALVGLPDRVDPLETIEPRYDAALRHTVRLPDRQGAHVPAEVLAASLRPTLAPPAMGATNPRLIRDGLAREEEAVAAAAGDPFKERTVSFAATGRVKRRKSPSHAEKPTAMALAADGSLAEAPPDAAPGSAVPPTLPAGARGSAFVVVPPPGKPRLFELHKNVSTAPLPGNLADTAEADGPLREALLSSPFAHANGLWSRSQLEHSHRVDGDGAEGVTKLEEDGKVPLTRADLAPMFSSFSADKQFVPLYVVPGGGPRQPASPSLKTLAHAASLAPGGVPLGVAGAHRTPAYRAQLAAGAPGPGSPLPLKAPLPGDVEPRRASVYGVEVHADGALRDLRAEALRGAPVGVGGLLRSPMRGAAARPASLPPSPAGGGGFGAVRTGGFLSSGAPQPAAAAGEKPRVHVQ
jgi:hypothetical protein